MAYLTGRGARGCNRTRLRQLWQVWLECEPADWHGRVEHAQTLLLTMRIFLQASICCLGTLTRFAHMPVHPASTCTVATGYCQVQVAFILRANAELVQLMVTDNDDG